MPNDQVQVRHDTILQQLNWRYAVKKFDAKRQIPAKDWDLLAESLRLAPSSYGLQPWRFIVVQSPEVRKQLTPVSWNQTQIADCSHLVVLTHLKSVDEAYVDSYVQSIASTRNLPVANLKGYRDVMVNDAVKGPRAAVIHQWTARQAYIAMGSLMTVAALLHVDSCPMEGIDTAQYDSILGLKDGPYASVAVVAMGYRAAEDDMQHAAKVRFPLAEVVKYV